MPLLDLAQRQVRDNKKHHSVVWQLHSARRHEQGGRDLRDASREGLRGCLLLHHVQNVG